MDDKTFESDIVVIIRPSLKRACCEGDACRAAILNQLLYSIAWKLTTYDKDYWYGSYEEIYTKLLDESWGLSKVIKETKTLIAQGFIEQRRNPDKGWDQTRQYLFGEEQAKKFREACKKAGVCIEHQMGFPPDVIHLLKITNAISKNNKCNCQIQQMDSMNSTNASVKNNDAIPKTTTKTSSKITTKRENERPNEETTPETSFSPSLSSQSSFSEEKGPKEVVFTEKQMIVYTLAQERKYSRLKKDTKHQVHCEALAEAGVTTGEKMDSLEKFCREKLSYKGHIDLCLGNLVSELNGWLQVQRLTQEKKPLLVGQLHTRDLREYNRAMQEPYRKSSANTNDAEVTDADIAGKIREYSFICGDDSRVSSNIKQVEQIKQKFGVSNEKLYDDIINAYRECMKLNKKSMPFFFEQLQGILSSALNLEQVN